MFGRWEEVFFGLLVEVGVENGLFHQVVGWAEWERRELSADWLNQECEKCL
jgi:hypothetical protein